MNAGSIPYKSMDGVTRERVLDRALWLAVLGLMLVGAAFIFSATGANESARGASWHGYTAVRQTVAYVLGAGLVAALCLVDYSRLARWAMVAYWASIGLLACVYLFGVERLGAKRWIDLGPVQFQPSEFAKLAFGLTPSASAFTALALAPAPKAAALFAVAKLLAPTAAALTPVACAFTPSAVALSASALALSPMAVALAPVALAAAPQAEALAPLATAPLPQARALRPSIVAVVQSIPALGIVE